MASIACAIELYDGVSPVLGDMAAALDGLAGQFTRFGEEMGDVSPGVEGLDRMGDALAALAEGAGAAVGAMDAIGAAGAAVGDVFSPDMFLPLLEGAGAAVESVEALGLAAETCAAGLEPAFSPAGRAVCDVFAGMAGEIQGTLTDLGSFVAGFAAGLPGYFAGPLARISAMFASTAASARASLASITSSAGAAVAAVSRVSAAAASVSVSQLAVEPVDPVAERVSLGALDTGGGELVYMAEEADGFRMPEAVEGRDDRETVVRPQVTVTVMNENHISSEADVDAVLRAFEVRLADAVASSIEGVYA